MMSHFWSAALFTGFDLDESSYFTTLVSLKTNFGIRLEQEESALGRCVKLDLPELVNTEKLVILQNDTEVCLRVELVDSNQSLQQRSVKLNLSSVRNVRR